jgi:hypothetical protein
MNKGENNLKKNPENEAIGSIYIIHSAESPERICIHWQSGAFTPFTVQVTTLLRQTCVEGKQMRMIMKLPSIRGKHRKTTVNFIHRNNQYISMSHTHHKI